MFSNKFGINSLLKEGYKVVRNSDDVILQNIESCKEISRILQTSLGPKCMNKLIINHINKKVVSSDCMTILKDLEINHPVVNIIKTLSETMNTEYGDFTNYVFTLTTEILDKASFLIQQGFNVNEIIATFLLGYEHVKSILPSFIVYKFTDVHNEKEIEKVIRSVMVTKQLTNNYDCIIKLLSKCIVEIMPEKPERFNVDDIRVSKINGGNLVDSEFFIGMVILRDTHGVVKKKENCNAIVLNCGLEAHVMETKGTVLLHNAQELINFTKGEEDQMEKTIKAVKDAGVDVIVVNGSVSDIALHFCDVNNILVLKVTSKFDTQRICKLLCISPMLRLEAPTADNIGKIGHIYVTEIASKKVTIINGINKKVGTILLRGATYNLLDEIERCINDGINSVKNAIKDNSFLHGGGCVEIQISESLKQYAQKSLSGTNNYGVRIFAEAFEVIPKTLATNAGYNGTDVLNELIKEHKKKTNSDACINVNKDSHITSAGKNQIYDNFRCKQHAIDLAMDAVQTILKIDQIILSKPAGGPKLRDKNPNFDE